MRDDQMNSEDRATQPVDEMIALLKEKATQVKYIGIYCPAPLLFASVCEIFSRRRYNILDV